MYEALMCAHDRLSSQGLVSSLEDTLHLIDILSNGAVRRVNRQIGSDQRVDLDRLGQERTQGRPLEYILGRATFMGLELVCSPDTLIPREETELLATVALDLIRELTCDGKTPTVVDMGTGCGNLAASIAYYAPHTKVLASDVSEAAILVAGKNVDRLGLSDRVTLLCGDLFAPLEQSGYEQQIDLVVCNPPYIPSQGLKNLSPEIIEHEPIVALDAGAYGIGIFRRLITDSLRVLRPGGVLVFEIGAGQDRLVSRLVQRNGGYTDIRHFEGNGAVRVISAVKV